MQPQQTDVLDVTGTAAAPSISEGAIAPTSPVIYEDELFGDNPVMVTGPVAIVERTPTTASSGDDVTAEQAVEADTATDNVTPSEDADVEPNATAEADTVPSDDDASVEAEQTAGAPDGDLDVEKPVERVQPPEPELEFTLEQLEAATPRPTGEKHAEPAANDAVTDAEAEGEPTADSPAPTDDSDDEDAPVVVVAAPVPAADADAETAAAPAAETASPAPEKTATYEELMNSQQEFVGAIKTKKFPLIDPDQFWVMVAAVVALGTILAANLTASFTSVYAMAEYTGLPKSVQAVPVVALDFAIVGFSWALMVFGARGDKVWSTRLYLFVVTGFSVVANFMHTYTHWKGDLSSPEAIFGVVFSSAVPLFSLVATEELIRLVFIRRNRRKTKKAVA